MESECNLYFDSNYFDWMVQFAEYLITSGHAYVDSQSAEQMRATRGTLTDTGSDSPYRTRSLEENMDLFKRMQQGEFPDGAHILRAKIDMAAANINLRDPAIYRIRHATHHNTGDKWCVYPMYTFAHPIALPSLRIDIDRSASLGVEIDDHTMRRDPPFREQLVEQLRRETHRQVVHEQSLRLERHADRA